MSQSPYIRHLFSKFIETSLHVRSACVPFLDLWIRVCLARVFFVPGLSEMIGPNGGSTASLHQSTVPWLALHHGSSLGISIELGAPLLLAFGIFSRPAALALLILSIVAQFDDSTGGAHLSWIALLSWYVLQGSGSLSVDRLLRHGLESSAVPFAPQLLRGAAALSDASRAAILLALRIFVSATLLESFLSMSYARMANLTVIPTYVALTFAASILSGLAVPVSSCALLLFALGANLMMGHTDISLYFSLVLSLLVLYGGGRWSADAWLKIYLMSL
jgi:uncharacterized membrane protein YphA (DoxX/SURF4 family)